MNYASQHRKARAAWEARHVRCPKCGSQRIMQTCGGSVWRPGEEYRSRETGYCMDQCGWKGSLQELVP